MEEKKPLFYEMKEIGFLGYCFKCNKNLEPGTQRKGQRYSKRIYCFDCAAILEATAPSEVKKIQSGRTSGEKEGAAMMRILLELRTRMARIEKALEYIGIAVDADDWDAEEEPQQQPVVVEQRLPEIQKRSIMIKWPHLDHVRSAMLPYDSPLFNYADEHGVLKPSDQLIDFTKMEIVRCVPYTESPNSQLLAPLYR